jgi:hypothetical protein
MSHISRCQPNSRAAHRYEHDKEVLRSTVNAANDMFVAPLKVMAKMINVTSHANDFMVFGACGMGIVVAPAVMAPFSTTAGILTYTVVVPALKVKACIDRRRVDI